MISEKEQKIVSESERVQSSRTLVNNLGRRVKEIRFERDEMVFAGWENPPIL